MIEAELKARVRDPDGLHAQLRRLSEAEPSTYHDAYYDHAGRDLTGTGRELRLRTITDAHGQQRSLLTYKEAAVDQASGSKPEHESGVDDPAAVDVLLRGLPLCQAQVRHRGQQLLVELEG